MQNLSKETINYFSNPNLEKFDFRYCFDSFNRLSELDFNCKYQLANLSASPLFNLRQIQYIQHSQNLNLDFWLKHCNTDIDRYNQAVEKLSLKTHWAVKQALEHTKNKINALNDVKALILFKIDEKIKDQLVIKD